MVIYKDIIYKLYFFKEISINKAINSSISTSYFRDRENYFRT